MTELWIPTAVKCSCKIQTKYVIINYYFRVTPCSTSKVNYNLQIALTSVTFFCVQTLSPLVWHIAIQTL